MSVLYLGDARDVLAALPEWSVDAVVTDPPYGLSFMGSQWDYDVPSVDLWRKVLRVLKPGGSLLAFSGTRTYHRMVVNIEDAGFEIRDQLDWLYGTGFPKSVTLSLDIDSAFGVTRKATEPAVTDDAREWDGWGTALKPGHEPIVLARRPLAGTIVDTVLRHGTGALNIRGSQVPFASVEDERSTKTKNAHADFGSGPRGNEIYGADRADRADRGNYCANGRYPANVILGCFCCRDDGTHAPECSVSMLDAQSDGASRFFYVAKASREERDAGLEQLPPRSGHAAVKRKEGTAALASPRTGAGRSAESVKNFHPTVKPVALMRYLCKLVTPPGGVVLDPFTGSGTTGVAALREGFGFVGVERDAEYLPICEGRVGGAARELGAAFTIDDAHAEKPAEQQHMFGVGT